MSNTLRLVDENEVEVLVLRPSHPAWGDPIFVYELDLGFPQMREVRQDAPGADGAIDVTQRFSSRQVALKLKVVGDAGTTSHAYYDMLRGLCAPARRPYLYVRRDGWIAERRMQLRGSTGSCVVQAASAAYLDVSLAWQVPSGVMEGADANDDLIRPLSLTTGGVSFPLKFTSSGVDWGAGTASNVAILTNYGNVDAPLFARVYGGVTDPAIVNHTTGRQFRMKGVTVLPGHYLDIDVGNRTVYMDSDPGQSYYGLVDWTQSSWMTIAAGDNAVEFVSTAPDAASQVQISFRDRWI